MANKICQTWNRQRHTATMKKNTEILHMDPTRRKKKKEEKTRKKERRNQQQQRKSPPDVMCLRVFAWEFPPSEKNIYGGYRKKGGNRKSKQTICFYHRRFLSFRTRRKNLFLLRILIDFLSPKTSLVANFFLTFGCSRMYGFQIRHYSMR